MSAFKAGVAIGDISPEKTVDLGGYPYFYRHNTGVHDPLFCTCLYLENTEGGQQMLITGDLLALTRKQCDAIKSRIYGLTGIPSEKLVISSSHSHSAPWTRASFNFADDRSDYKILLSESYIEMLIERISALAAQAKSECFEAEFAYVRTSCGKEQGIGGNRRDPENGPSDPDLPLVFIRTRGGELRAIFTKYALHPTILHGESCLVSADYPGYIRKYLAERFPRAIFMFAQGTSGDQSPRFFRKDQNFAEARRFGETLGKAIEAAYPRAKFSSELHMRKLTREMELKMKDYSDEARVLALVDRYKKVEAEKIAAGAPYTEIQTANLWVLGAECELNYTRLNKEGRLDAIFESSKPYEVSVLVLNELALVFLPGEFFVEYGLKIKAASPYKETHVLTMSNGDLPGYCVTPAALEEGGYEAWNSLLEPSSGQAAVDTALQLLDELWNGGKNGETRL